MIKVHELDMTYLADKLTVVPVSTGGGCGHLPGPDLAGHRTQTGGQTLSLGLPHALRPLHPRLLDSLRRSVVTPSQPPRRIVNRGAVVMEHCELGCHGHGAL